MVVSAAGHTRFLEYPADKADVQWPLCGGVLPISTAVPSALPANTPDVAREIDLTGATIREITMATLNSRLAAAGFNYTAQFMHHDMAVLPNGHWILIVNSVRPEIENGTTVDVLGDALIDLDTNLNPVWVWDTFDHLDVNRHPVSVLDWTHSNAILYSATDGNLLLSMRHQNWIIKIDYNNGKGAGDILWHLGYQGDFALVGGIDPTDWFSGQHGPSFTTANTAGTFGLALMDNGDFRTYPAGVTCADTGAPSCPYSTAQVLNIDETAKTATFAFHNTTPIYSFFGGNAEVFGEQGRRIRLGGDIHDRATLRRGVRGNAHGSGANRLANEPCKYLRLSRFSPSEPLSGGAMVDALGDKRRVAESLSTRRK